MEGRDLLADYTVASTYTSRFVHTRRRTSLTVQNNMSKLILENNMFGAECADLGALSLTISLTISTPGEPAKD
jgi:hypothetical protein